ncbi:MAG: F0F1 ATP synthase subunit gamma, partial [Candidatus Omnitrophica bacterium]|nr:F0F1 ATP synthase subunit gamma [Candidatus Omnitrophota bacterium]
MRLLAQIKKDLDFNNNLYNLVEVLKEISISQYRIMEKKIKSFDKVFNALESLFEMFDPESSNHPLINTGNRQPGVIAITSDSGLLGGLNMQVMNSAVKEAVSSRATLIIIGEKGKVFAKDSGLPTVNFKGIKDETRYEQAVELRDFIVKEELAGRLGALEMIYPYSISLFSQQVQVIKLLPFSKADNIRVKNEGSFYPDIIYESPIDDVVGYLIYLLLSRKFYETFGLARL